MAIVDPKQYEMSQLLQREYLRHSILLLYGTTGYELGDGRNGTGVLLRCGERLFVVTAKHVVEEAAGLSILTIPGEPPVRIRADDVVDMHPILVAKHPKPSCDVALIEVAPTLADLLNRSPLARDHLDCEPLRDDPSRATYSWAGYPSHIRSDTAGGNIVFQVCNTSPVTPPPAPDHPRFANISFDCPLDPGMDLWLIKPAKGRHVETWEMGSTARFQLPGVSGGGIWKIPPPIPGKIWAVEGRVRLVGVTHHVINGEEPDTQWVRGTSVKAIEDILRLVGAPCT